MKSFLTLRATLYIVIAVVLIAILGFLVSQTRSINFDAYNKIVNTLRDLKQVDAEWNVDVLRSKTGLSNDYDPVASPLPLIASLQSELATETRSYWGANTDSDERIKPLVSKFSGLMEDKVNAIEQFKSQNAILRNSSRFLPVAATDLAEAARSSTMPPAALSALERSLNDLLANTMTYAQTPDDALRERITVGTKDLLQATGAQSTPVRDAGATLAAHVGTVLRQQDSGAELLGQLTALPTAQSIDELTDAQSRENDTMIVTLQNYQRALTAYSALLLLVLGFLAWRVFRYYQMLNQSNGDLQRANLELKESQVHLVQAEKMSALGQMVAGIAHEINTPLAYVKGTFSVLKDQLNPINALATQSYGFTQSMRATDRDNVALNKQFRHIETSARNVIESGVIDDIGSLLTDGIHGIEQISEIVLNLKNFSRLDREKVANFSVEAGLDSTLLLARNLLKDRVQIEKNYSQVPMVSGSPSQINQVFLNIITNAAHAMPNRETPNVIRLHTSMHDAQTVRIDIADNGNGIPKEVLPKIFDPFFTTKPIGEGTGMGLSISYKIIAEHGGELLVDTQDGVGTTFSILLPYAAQSVENNSNQTALIEEHEEEALFAD